MAHFLIIPFYCTDVCYRPSSPFPGDVPPSLITLRFGNSSTCKCLNLQNGALLLPMLNNPPSVSQFRALVLCALNCETEPLQTGTRDPRHKRPCTTPPPPPPWPTQCYNKEGDRKEGRGMGRRAHLPKVYVCFMLHRILHLLTIPQTLKICSQPAE